MDAKTKVRVALGWVLLGVLAAVVGAVSVVSIALAATGGYPAKSRHAKVKHGCSSAACAQIGDDVSYTVSGKVTAVSEPAPGWRCVAYQSPTEGAQKCAKK